MDVKKLQKANTVLFFCFLIIVGLYYGAAFFIPLAFGIFFAALIVPVCNFLENKWGLGRITSSLISTFILLIGVGFLIFIFFRQLENLLADLIERKEDIQDYITLLQEEIARSTGLSNYQQEEILRNRSGFFFDMLPNMITNFFAGIAGTLVNLLVVLIYVMLLLINRDKFKEFIMSYVIEEKKENTNDILSQIQKVAHKYLWGRLQVMIVLAIMYTIAFYAYDLEYANLLIIFGVIITVIPYIGPFLSGLLPILFMIVFGGSNIEIVSFIIIVMIIQLIESYVAEPLIIGSEVHQSPLFVIIAVIIGGILWGIAGMILFVPIFGILKIIFDNNKDLEPLGFLMGYKRPGSGEDIFDKIKRIFKK